MSERTLQSILESPRAALLASTGSIETITVKWKRVKRSRTRGRRDLPTLRELNNWFNANYDFVSAESERACREATGQDSL